MPILQTNCVQAPSTPHLNLEYHVYGIPEEHSPLGRSISDGACLQQSAMHSTLAFGIALEGDSERKLTSGQVYRRWSVVGKISAGEPSMHRRTRVKRYIPRVLYIYINKYVCKYIII